MAVDRIDRTVARIPGAARRRETSRTDSRRDTGTGPVLAVVRSLLMVALAALAILGLLPAVVGVAAAA